MIFTLRCAWRRAWRRLRRLAERPDPAILEAAERAHYWHRCAMRAHGDMARGAAKLAAEDAEERARFAFIGEGRTGFERELRDRLWYLADSRHKDLGPDWSALPVEQRARRLLDQALAGAELPSLPARPARRAGPST